MKAKYVFKGKNITTLVILKIDKVVSLLAFKLNLDYYTALDVFYKSRVYEAMIDTKNILWAESAEFVVDELMREKEVS